MSLTDKEKKLTIEALQHRIDKDTKSIRKRFDIHIYRRREKLEKLKQKIKG